MGNLLRQCEPGSLERFDSLRENRCQLVERLRADVTLIIIPTIRVLRTLVIVLPGVDLVVAQDQAHVRSPSVPLRFVEGDDGEGDAEQDGHDDLVQSRIDSLWQNKPAGVVLDQQRH